TTLTVGARYQLERVSVIPKILLRQNGQFAWSFSVIGATGAYPREAVAYDVLLHGVGLRGARGSNSESMTMAQVWRWPLAALLALGLGWGATLASAQDVGGIETLTRGPLHEAYAEPLTLEAQETLIIDQEPPTPIDELPPEYKP